MESSIIGQSFQFQIVFINDFKKLVRQDFLSLSVSWLSKSKPVRDKLIVCTNNHGVPKVSEQTYHVMNVWSDELSEI